MRWPVIIPTGWDVGVLMCDGIGAAFICGGFEDCGVDAKGFVDDSGGGGTRSCCIWS